MIAYAPSSPNRPDSGSGFGSRLAHLRMARGWSQLGLAEQLCAASGLPTITRHEISRWERQQRIPGDFWLAWLAAVLDAPLHELTAAAAASRRATARRDSGPLYGVPRLRNDLLDLAHTWLTDPTSPIGDPGRIMAAMRADPGGGPDPGDDRDAVDAPPAEAVVLELERLRRMDDLVGGVDLTAPAGRPLGMAARALSAATPRTRRRLLGLAAESDQLAGWILGDAGKIPAAVAAYCRGLAAAAAAGDRPLAGHVLGSASHLLAAQHDPRSALALARAGLAGAGRTPSAGTRALLLQRVAFAAAASGRRREAEAALTAAERAAERRDVERDPPWLYWLDAGELAAMTGRCLAALGRPLRAEPLLASAVARPGRPRTSAIYGAWLARTYLDLGEAERAYEVASAALLDAIRAGSPRARAALDLVDRRLRVHRDDAAGRRYAALVAAARTYLVARSGGSATRSWARGPGRSAVPQAPRLSQPNSGAKPKQASRGPEDSAAWFPGARGRRPRRCG